MGVALEVIGGARLPPRRPRETTPSHRSRHSGEASPWGRGGGRPRQDEAGTREEGAGESRRGGARRAAEGHGPAHRRARLPPAVLRRARLRPRGGAGPQRTAVLTSPRGGAPRGFWERRGPHLLRAQGDGRDSPRGRRAPRGRGRSGAPREPGLRGRGGIARVPGQEGREASRRHARRLMGGTDVRPRRPPPSPSEPARHSGRLGCPSRGRAVSSPSQARSAGVACAQVGGHHTCPTAAIGWHGRHVVS